MLGDEDRMSAHGRLLAVPRRMGGSQTFGNKDRTMLHNRIKSPAFEIESRLIVQMKLRAKTRPRKAFEQFLGVKSAHQPTTF